MLRRMTHFVGSLLALLPAAALAQTFTLTTVATGLSDIVQIRHAGDARKFVVLQGGTIRVLDAGNSVLATPFLAMTSVTNCQFPDGSSAALGFTSGSERGLLGLAFHPQYAANGQLFINFTDGRGDTTVARFTRDAGNPDVVDYASCAVVLRIDQDFANHNAGDLAFGPDGLLYVPMGDGGDSNDTCNRAQTLNPANLVNSTSCTVDTNFTGIGGGDGDSRALLGKLVRIDIDGTTIKSNATGLCGAMDLPAAAGTTVVANYRVPQAPDVPNPATIDGQDPCDEVWAYGLRNPFRFSFDRQTGDMYLGDVGQGTTEEVSFQPAASTGGENYGWRFCEGPFNRGSSSGTCTNLTTPHTPPILFYSSNPSRCSVIGGYRYRGSSPSAFGKYFYGDYCTGEVFIGTQTGSNWAGVVAPVAVSGFGLYGFGEDAAGELYVSDANLNTLLRFDFTDAVMFRNGFE
jgi:glucose/arabinose dehydrogenase